MMITPRSPSAENFPGEGASAPEHSMRERVRATAHEESREGEIHALGRVKWVFEAPQARRRRFRRTQNYLVWSHRAPAVRAAH
jgi:hypothetical protein